MKAILPTKRDVTLLVQLAEYHFLSSDQIHRMVFQNIDFRTMLRRLRCLRDRGLICSEPALPNGGLLWFLTEKGCKLVGVKSHKPSINRNQIEHDVAINEVRLKLEKLKIVKQWQSVRLLYEAHGRTAFLEPGSRPQLSALLPDGIFALETREGERVVALEVETNRKSERRYGELFSDYKRKSSIDLILYLVSTKSLGEFISQIAKRTLNGSPRPKLLWGMLEDALVYPRALTLYAGEKALLLSELCELPTVHHAVASVDHDDQQQNPAHSGAHRVSTAYDLR